MKKFIVTASAALIAILSVAGSAAASDRRGHEEILRHGERHGAHRDRGRDPGFHDGGRRHVDRHGWRGDRRHWRHDGWRYGGYPGYYWGGPRVVIGGPVYIEPSCFKKKVYRTDAWGNVYIKRVRVCR
jgi:Ni/Co efflux regulator RcnB